jgi:glycosyltransferase involved in cell wall biosynthesis
MRVAIDARSMQASPLGGVGRGLHCLLPTLSAHADVQLLTAAEAAPVASEHREQQLTTPWPGLAAGWLQWSVPRYLRSFDGVFHCPWYGLPVRQPVPMVVTIHDLTFERHPEWFRRGQARAYSWQARLAARTARMILTPSAAVAADVMETYNVSPARIVIAANALDPVFKSPSPLDEARASWGLTGDYVVAIGGADRRNLGVAMATWRALRADLPIQLFVAGEQTLPTEPGLVTGRPSDAEWAAVLGGARALVYPTRYEGFGMPALEAIASGTPVVCGRVGALPEVLGDAAAWSDDLSVPAMTSALRRVLTNDGFAQELSRRGRIRAAAHITWEQSALIYLDAYRRAADG